MGITPILISNNKENYRFFRGLVLRLIWVGFWVV